MNRFEEGDIPELYASIERKDNRHIPQTVAFIDDNGTEISISVERALELKLIQPGEITRVSMSMEEWSFRKSQEQKRNRKK